MSYYTHQEMVANISQALHENSLPPAVRALKLP